jgi:hypothetical protein
VWWEVVGCKGCVGVLDVLVVVAVKCGDRECVVVKSVVLGSLCAI